MRITGGHLRNRIVKSSTEKTVRPTSAKMRGAIFSMIGQNLQGQSFLDAFGGSGIMGLEARSRGASPVLISEKKQGTFRSIIKMVKELQDDVTVQCQDAKRSICSQEWDIIFLDPPYAFDIQPYLDLAFEHGSDLVVAEVDPKTDVKYPKETWELFKQKTYGHSKLLIFRKDQD